MDALLQALIVLVLVIALLGIGTWVFAGLLLVSFSALVLVAEMDVDRVGSIMRATVWRSVSTWELAAVPLFIMMGEVLFRTDVSERLFRGLAPWADLIPGRLLHANIAGCTLFAAVSGSSAATTATVGKITTTALAERGYDTDLSIGSLAGAGSLGLMIPPSIIFIVYGVLAEVSIARLFAAGVLPGLFVAALYSGYIAVRAFLKPAVAPPTEMRLTFGDRLRSTIDLLPIFVLMVLVLGGIYTGVATPSEAGALGLAGSLVLVLAMGQLTVATFMDALLGAVRTTCMVISIIAAASFLSSAMGFLHVPQEIAAGVGRLELSPYELILVLSLFYIVLGLFLDGVSILVMSLPITLPLIVVQGFDPIWFGVFLVLMTELAMITPPIGFNLFVIQGLTGHSIGRIAIAALPFFVLMCVATITITILPEIALWLPRVLFG